jgi:quercetin dioxygenase-like cupin family protein
MKYKSEFSQLPWETPIVGVRHKYFDQNGVRLRLVEYSKSMPEHCCEKGHFGYLLDGKLEIEFETKKEIYEKGDAIFIPDGAEHKHKGKALTEKVKVFFVENL